MTQCPNRQNERIWAAKNPNEVCEVKDQSAQKVMAFVCMVDGKVLPVLWFKKEKRTDKVTVTQAVYVKMLKEKILCHFTDEQLSNYWWSQDGAPAHAAGKTIEFLKSVFNDRIISRALRKDHANEIIN